MNSQHLAFTAHDGDLKSGSSECTDSVYTQALGFFKSLRAPAIFTPGDNDWVDCDRTPGYNSLVQLDKERALFFSTHSTLGQNTFVQEVQSSPLCLGVSGMVPCVENRRWTVNRVTYATLNIQGSCNNRCSTAPDENEYHYRDLADIAWMQQTFAEARTRGSAAVMFISQADPGFNQDSSQGRRLENFTRVETFGDNQQNGTNDVNWLKVLVDPNSREVFAYQPQIVPANRVAVPLP